MGGLRQMANPERQEEGSKFYVFSYVPLILHQVLSIHINLLQKKKIFSVYY